MDGSAKVSLSKSEMIRTLGALDHLFFPYDFTKAVLDRIDVFYEMSQASSRANIMLLYGETGCGKSTLAEKYRDKIVKHVTVEDDDLPALLVATPANCTIKALASHILVQLGDPLAYKGTVPELTKRVVGLIRDKNITLLILDEFQHLMDKKNDQIAYDVADWLKSIVNEISCPIMLVGLPTTKIIINKNEQLERRVSACAELTSFPDNA